MSTPQPPERTPATDEPVTEESATEAELYAASAAENALPSDSNLPQDADDLAALSGALDAAALSDEEVKGEKAVSTAEGTPAKHTDESDRTLTKEEMIEEALNCPCIAAMKDGPCGDAFVAAYRCFLESDTEPKGMDCMQQFTGMQSCMAEHPEAYADDDDDDPFAVGDNHETDPHKSEQKREKEVLRSDKGPSAPPTEPVSS